MRRALCGRGAPRLAVASLPWWAGPLAVVWLMVAAPSATPDENPGVLLIGATTKQASDLAASSATQKGWRLLWVTPEEAAFEQTLSPSGDDDAGAPLRLIRVFARFEQESAGARVLLRAEEVEAPDGGPERGTDATEGYRDNLEHALSSLRTRWETGSAASGADETGRRTDQDLAREPVTTSHLQAPSEVGTWAYYAEGYAQSRGCMITDSGALLEAAGPDWERHLVGCRDGRRLRVFCSHGDCTGSP